MAKKKSSSKKSTKGNTGGRVSSSEPRLQVFKDFSGCNFEFSPRDMVHLGTNGNFDVALTDQSDLQMNFVVVQNNLATTSNRTFETRNNLVPWCRIYDDREFTGVASSVGKGLIAAVADNLWSESEEITNEVYYVEGYDVFQRIPSEDSGSVQWSSFGIVDDTLLGLCKPDSTEKGKRYQIYTTKVPPNFPEFPESASEMKLKHPVYIPDPTQPLPSISAGTSSIGMVQSSVGAKDSADEKHPYRLTITYAFANEFGTTKAAPSRTYYLDTPVTRLSSSSYIRFSLSAPNGAKSCEFFATSDDAVEMKFAGRVDAVRDSFMFTFTGYAEMPENWLLGSSVVPDDNYTLGPPALHFNVIDGKMYYWGDSNRLYWGGEAGNIFSVSRGYGGGFTDINPAENPKIRYVEKYKTQSGANSISILCDSERSSRERRYNLVETNTGVSNENTTQSRFAEQVAGAVGCKSPYGAKVCQDGLYSVSRYGLALTTLTMEYNSQIATNYVSSAIRPVFSDRLGVDLSNAILFEADGVLYLAFGKTDSDQHDYENIVFCYDISAKAWWTYTLPIEGEPILNMVHIDGEDAREGIAVITPKAVYLLPLTQDDSPEDDANEPVMIMTGELSTQMPLQGYHYLSQIEFHFDYFRGDLDVKLIGIDIFGRKVTVDKKITTNAVPGDTGHVERYHTEYNLTEYMRVDLKLRSYKLVFSGKARMRMTHWISKVYTMSNKVGQVWGFDDRMSFRSQGDIHPTFKDYNDIKNAIIT